MAEMATRRAYWPLWVWMLPLLLGSATALAQLWPVAQAELLLMRTRWHIGQWLSGQSPLPSSQAWNKAYDQLVATRSLTPTDPQQAEAMAYLLILRAQTSAAVPAVAGTFYRLAAAQLRQSLANRPMSGATWVTLAFVLQPLIDGDPALANEFWYAFDQAMAYGQREPQVQLTLVQLAVQRWGNLSPQRRQAVQQLLEDLVAPHTQARMNALLLFANRTDLTPSTWEAASAPTAVTPAR